MNVWEKRRKLSNWYRGLATWTEDDPMVSLSNHRAYISVVFSWQMQDAYQTAVWFKLQGYQVSAGGPAVRMQPHILADVADLSQPDYPDAISHHNPNATFTSRGCIRRCSFCAVPKIEGALRELQSWPVRPIVCDNNLLACSQAHFDRVIDALKHVPGVDFSQGLDARLLTKHHAQRIAELDVKCVRLAWDHTRDEPHFNRAWDLLRSVGIPKAKIHVYVLIGYSDTPDDALYRLSTIWALGSWPNPMRYQPLTATAKNQHVGTHWTHRELQRFMKYWSNLRHLSAIPFSEYKLSSRSHAHTQELQLWPSP